MRDTERFSTRAVRTNSGGSSFVVTDRGILPTFIGDDGKVHSSLELANIANVYVDDRCPDNPMPRVVGTMKNVSYEQTIYLSDESHLDDASLSARHWVDITGGFLNYDHPQVRTFVRDIIGYPDIVGAMRTPGVARRKPRLRLPLPRVRQTDPDAITDARDGNGGTLVRPTLHRRIRETAGDRHGPAIVQSFDQHGQCVQYGADSAKRYLRRQYEDVYGAWPTPLNDDGVFVGNDAHYRIVTRSAPTDNVFVGLRRFNRTTTIKRGTSSKRRADDAKRAERKVGDIALLAHSELDYIVDGFSKATPDQPSVMMLEHGTLTIPHGKGVRTVKYVLNDGATFRRAVRNPRAIARFVEMVTPKV